MNLKRNFVRYAFAAGLLAFGFMSVIITQAASDKPTAELEKMQQGNRVLEGEVKPQAEKEISQRRNKLVDEAISGLAETKNALRALEWKKSQEALAALERASDKLNTLLGGSQSQLLVEGGPLCS